MPRYQNPAVCIIPSQGMVDIFGDISPLCVSHWGEMSHTQKKSCRCVRTENNMSTGSGFQRLTNQCQQEVKLHSDRKPILTVNSTYTHR